MLVPLAILVMIQVFNLDEELRKLLYFVSVILIQVGIFSTRWNVVIGGQMFSKSFLGLTTYKMELVGIEGLVTALGLLILPFIVLAVLMKILPPLGRAAGSGPHAPGPEAGVVGVGSA